MFRVSSLCISAAIPHTVLLELFQERLVTEDDVERMKGDGGDLPKRLVIVQCTKPPEVVTKTAGVLDKFGHSEEARQLRGTQH